MGSKRIDPFGNALFERCGMWLKAAALHGGLLHYCPYLKRRYRVMVPGRYILSEPKKTSMRGSWRSFVCHAEPAKVRPSSQSSASGAICSWDGPIVKRRRAPRLSEVRFERAALSLIRSIGVIGNKWQSDAVRCWPHSSRVLDISARLCSTPGLTCLKYIGDQPGLMPGFSFPTPGESAAHEGR